MVVCIGNGGGIAQRNGFCTVWSSSSSLDAQYTTNPVTGTTLAPAYNIKAPIRLLKKSAYICNSGSTARMMLDAKQMKRMGKTIISWTAMTLFNSPDSP